MALSYVVLRSRRSLELTDLRLSCTYAGLLEGMPNEAINKEIIDSLMASAAREHPNRPVHLVPPPRTYPDEPASRSGGRIEILPRVACIGTFESDAIGPDADPDWDRSWLTAVWFQEEASLDGIREAVADMPWREVARDMTL